MANDLISRKALIDDLRSAKGLGLIIAETIVRFLKKQPTVDAVEVVHARWVLTAHEEYVNYRWKVTAECSACHHDKGEVYAGFFSGFPTDIARDIVLEHAESVKLDNYCPNCGADMRGAEEMKKEKRLIDANALKDALRTNEGAKALGHSVYRLFCVDEIIDEQSTVDAVEVVHGRWIQDTQSKFEHRYNCSACNYRLIDVPCNYCPNCGAYMRGTEE